MVMADQYASKPGCFYRFVRVILCAGTDNAPPIHPSDHFAESRKTELVKKDSMANAATPGVVARLMGLESLPNSNWVSKAVTPDSVPRSRSVNFVDYLMEFDLNNQANHRRVKTSASFREVPALFPQKNHHDLVVLYWENESKNCEAQMRKSELCFRESKQRKKQGSNSKEVVRERVAVKKEKHQGKNKKISKLKNEPRRVPAKRSSKIYNHSGSVSPRTKNNGGASSSSKSSGRGKEAFVEVKLSKSIRNQQSAKTILQTEHSVENLSPVSVLDVDDDFTFPYESIFSEESSPLDSKSKRKSSAQLYLSGDIKERGRGNNKGNGPNGYHPDVNRETEYWSELMGKLCRLTENDLRESDCTPKSLLESESFEEISLHFEHKIFDLLLHEVVNELVE